MGTQIRLTRQGNRWWLRCAGALLGAALGVQAIPGTAQAAVTGYVTPLYSAAAAYHTKCVMPRNGVAFNGAPLVLARCNGDPRSQGWFGNNDRSVRSAIDWPDGVCVGLANRGSTTNGTPLILWDCHLHPDQRWRFRPLGNGNYAWVNAPSGKCVGLADRGSTDDGTPLVIWDCHLHPDQRWRMNGSPYVFGLGGGGNI